MRVKRGRPSPAHPPPAPGRSPRQPIEGLVGSPHRKAMRAGHGAGRRGGAKSTRQGDLAGLAGRGSRSGIAPRSVRSKATLGGARRARARLTQVQVAEGARPDLPTEPVLPGDANVGDGHPGLAWALRAGPVRRGLAEESSARENSRARRPAPPSSSPEGVGGAGSKGKRRSADPGGRAEGTDGAGRGSGATALCRANDNPPKRALAGARAGER